MEYQRKNEMEIGSLAVGIGGKGYTWRFRVIIIQF